jgi:hypothetical protein
MQLGRDFSSRLCWFLSPDGLLLVPAALAERLTISVFPLIMKRSSVASWYSGTARD